MTSNIVSCLCWVPRGASKEKPDKVRRDWGGGRGGGGGACVVGQ